MTPQVLSGALAAGGGLFQGLANIGSTLLTNKANRELAQYSFEQQRQMIEEQNRYNSPVEQMKRFEEAGLNPALIYGNGTSSAGNQSSIAKYEAPTMQAPDVRLGIGEALQMALAFRQSEADIKLKEEQAYAQKMLGMGYEQDAYMKAVDSAVKAYNAGLRTPSGIWSADELDQIRSGNMVANYDAQTRSHQKQLDLQDTMLQLNKLNVREKDWVFNNMLPVQLKVEEAIAEGKDIENTLKGMEKQLYQDLENVGLKGGSEAVKIIMKFLTLLMKR